MAAGWISAIVAAYEAMNTPSGPSSQPTIDVNPHLPQIGNQWFGNIQNLNNLTGSYYGMLQPNALMAYSEALTNPYASSLPTQAASIAKTGSNAASGLENSAANILASSQDPQSALYDRTLQRVQDQARAANSAAGLGTSGVGAGLEDQATNNFNIDWQNQQLNRQIQGAQGASGAYNSALNDLTGTYQLPYAAAMQIPSGQLSAAGQYANVAGLYPQAISNLANLDSQYSGMGLNQQTAQYSQAYQNQMNQYAALNNTIMPLASAANQTWGSPGNTFANNLFGNSGTNAMQNAYYGNQLGSSWSIPNYNLSNMGYGNQASGSWSIPSYNLS